MSSSIGKTPPPTPESININQGNPINWVPDGTNFIGTKSVIIKTDDGREFSYKITLSNIADTRAGEALFTQHILDVMATAYNHGIVPGSKKSLEYTPDTRKYTKTKSGENPREFTPIDRTKQKTLYTNLSSNPEIKTKCSAGTLTKNDITAIDSQAGGFINLNQATVQMNKLKTQEDWNNKIAIIEKKILIQNKLQDIIKNLPKQPSASSTQPASASVSTTSTTSNPASTTSPASNPASTTSPASNPASTTSPASNPASSTSPASNPASTTSPHSPPASAAASAPASAWTGKSSSLPLFRLEPDATGKPSSHPSFTIEPDTIPAFAKISIEPDNTNLTSTEDSCIQEIKKLNERSTYENFTGLLEKLESRDSQIKVLRHLRQEKNYQELSKKGKEHLDQLGETEQKNVINSLNNKKLLITKQTAEALFPNLKTNGSQEYIELMQLRQNRQGFFQSFFKINAELNKDDYITFLQRKKPQEFLDAVLQASETNILSIKDVDFLKELKCNQNNLESNVDWSPLIDTVINVSNSLNIPSPHTSLQQPERVIPPTVEKEQMSEDEKKIINETIDEINYLNEDEKKLVRDIVTSNDPVLNSIQNLVYDKIILILGALTKRDLYFYIRGQKEKEIGEILGTHIINLEDPYIKQLIKTDLLGGFHNLFEKVRKREIPYAIFKICGINSEYVPLFQELITAQDNIDLTSIIENVEETEQLHFVSEFYNSIDYKYLSDGKKNQIKNIYRDLLEQKISSGTSFIYSQEITKSIIDFIIGEKGYELKPEELRSSLLFLRALTIPEIFNLVPLHQENIQGWLKYYAGEAIRSVDYLANKNLTIFSIKKTPNIFNEKKQCLIKYYNERPFELGFYLIHDALKTIIEEEVFEKRMHNYEYLISLASESNSSLDDTLKKSVMASLKPILEKKTAVKDFLNDKKTSLPIKKSVIKILEKANLINNEEMSDLNTYRKAYIQSSFDQLTEVKEEKFVRLLDRLKETDLNNSNAYSALYSNYRNNAQGKFPVLNENNRPKDAKKYVLELLIKNEENQKVFDIIFEELA